MNPVIAKLNPLLKGWANYFKIGVSSETFSSLDNYMWYRQYRYARRTHPKKAWGWTKEKYWGKLCPGRNDRWVFGCKETGNYMYKLSWTPIQRHVMVKRKHSPFDSALQDDWKKRALKNTSVLRTPSNTKIARRQNFICPVCSTHLYSNGERIDLHHLLYKSMGGKSEYNNLMLLHTVIRKLMH